MTDAYDKAIAKAEHDLKLLDTMAEETERQRAKLRQAIAVLKSLKGVEESRSGKSVTDVILEIVKATNGYVTAADVLEGVTARGYVVTPATIATLLSRLAKNGQIERGQEGYKWAGFSQRLHVEIT